MTLTPDLIEGIAGYLLARAPYDPNALRLYNAIIVQVNVPAEPEAKDEAE